jgi:hypothetical protein
MSATSIPANKNPLGRLGFDFRIKKLPYTNFFIQSVTLPGISLSEVIQPTPFVNIAKHGDMLQYDNIEVSFLVDEDLANYGELVTWMQALTFDQNFAQHIAVANTAASPGGELYTDASLIVMTSKSNPNIRCDFTDMFPVSLSELQFESTDDSGEKLIASVSFRFTTYSLNAVT